MSLNKINCRLIRISLEPEYIDIKLVIMQNSHTFFCNAKIISTHIYIQMIAIINTYFIFFLNINLILPFHSFITQS